MWRVRGHYVRLVTVALALLIAISSLTVPTALAVSVAYAAAGTSAAAPEPGPTLPARPDPRPLSDALSRSGPSPASSSAAATASAGSARAQATKPPTPSANKSCYTIISKIKPGQTTSDVLAQACRAKGDTAAPARVAEPTGPSARSATPQATPQAAAGVTVPLITFYEYSNYGGDSYTVYGNSGECDSEGYGISDNNTANDYVDGIRSYKAFNNCTNQTLYNQTQYRGPSAEFFGTATPYVGDTYADELLSVHLRTRCTTYSPSNNSVCDWIRQNYESNGGPSGFLGAPTSNQITNTDNVGARQTFANTGAIYYAPATGAHAVQGSILTKYNQLGAEGGTLGYPTRDNTRASDNVGVTTAFYKGPSYAAGVLWTANGSIVWSPNTGAHWLNGPVVAKYASLNDVASCHRYPTTDQATSSSGSSARFQGPATLPAPFDTMSPAPDATTYIGSQSNSNNASSSCTNDGTLLATQSTSPATTPVPNGPSATLPKVDYERQLRQQFSFNSDLNYVNQVDAVASNGPGDNKSLGIPMTPAERAELVRRESVGNQIATLSPQMPSANFSGAWMDQQVGGVLNMATTQLPSDLVMSGLPATLPAGTKTLLRDFGTAASASLARLNDLQAKTVTDRSQWQTKGVELTGSLVDVRMNKTIVSVSSDLTSARQQLEQSYGASGLAVVSAPAMTFGAASAVVGAGGARDIRDGRLYGGERISTPQAGGAQRTECTSGVSNAYGNSDPQNSYQVSAGHCAPPGAVWSQGFNDDPVPSPVIGTGLGNGLLGPGAGPAVNCDCQAIGPLPGGKVTSGVLVNNNAVFNFDRLATNDRDYYAGRIACLSGAQEYETYGRIICGGVVSSSVTVPLGPEYGNKQLISQVQMSTSQSIGGDSGGPWGSGATFMGIQSGMRGGQAVFSRSANIPTATGTTPLYG